MWIVVLAAVLAGTDSAVIRLRDTTYIVKEGSQFSVNVIKSGVARSQVNVVLQLEATFTNSNDDFIGSSVSTIFGAGTQEEIQTLVFTVRDDDLPEPDELFNLSIMVTNGDGVIGSPSTAKVYIAANDDPFGVFSFQRVEPVFVEELTVDNPVSLSVVRAQGTYGTITLTYEITSSQPEADPDQDFTGSRGTLVFSDGQTRNDLRIFVRPDNIPENDETFVVKLTQASGGYSIDPSVPGPSISNAEATVIIRQNDAPLRFSQAEYLVEEGANVTSAVVTVIRGVVMDDQTVIGPVATPASVDYYVTAVTATYRDDFLLSNGTLIFTPGATRANITALIMPDDVPEVAESFKITLVNPAGAVVLTNPMSTSVVINANDEPYGILRIKDTSNKMPVYTVNEDTTFQFSDIIITRNGGTFGAVSVSWEVVRNDTLPGSEDITPTSGQLTFEEGQQQKTVMLSILQDSTPEPAERYLFRLIPGSLQGGARISGGSEAQIIIQDSDNYYGIIDLGSSAVNASLSPRVLEVSIERRGGTLSELSLNYTITYWSPTGEYTDVMNVTMPALQRIPSGLASYTFRVPIKDTVFIQLGSVFRVELYSVQVQPPPELGTYNSPQLGSRWNISVPVTTESANGEVGFASLTEVFVDEPAPADPPNIVRLVVSRAGTSGDVTVFWNTVAVVGPGTQLKPTDIQPLSGFIVITSGVPQGVIQLQVLGDDEPETDESLQVNLTYVQPPSTQRVNPVRRLVTVTIRENDQPGGTFQFAPNMASFYSLREDLDSLVVSVVRTGASLIPSYIEYYIEPNGDIEFYGGRGVLTFMQGEFVKNVTIMPKGDGIPELVDDFVLSLRTYGERNNTFGRFNSINISVPANDQPYGVFQFNPLVASYYANESTATKNITAQVPVVRSKGRYGTVSVSWHLTDPNNTDLSPLQGTLQFGPGEGEKFIEFWVIPDDIPEEDEAFTIEISDATDGALMGTPTMTTLTIYKNDDAIYFKEPSHPFISEPGNITLVVIRDGPVDKTCTVKYKTVDGAAKAAELDYIPIPETLMVFQPGQREASFNVTALDDDLPEPNEAFYVDLYNVSCDLVPYFAPRAVVTILANDNANGMFHFEPTPTKTAQEGVPTIFVLRREKGQYGTVYIHYEILNVTTRMRVPSGEDFDNNTGMVTFNDRQMQANLNLVAKADGVPEYKETFIIRLYNVSGGGPNGQYGTLGGGPLEVEVEVTSNDNPTGLFSFAASSLEVSVAEDYNPGNMASTAATLTINRMMGAYETVMVSWAIFSYQIAGVGNLPEMRDLLFLADETPSVPSVPNKRRPATGTRVAQFTGCNACFMVVRPDYQPAASDIMDGFSVSAWFQTISHSEGYILAKTSGDGSRHFYALKMKTNSSGAELEFRYTTLEDQNNQVEAKAVVKPVQDGGWHQVVITMDTTTLTFYIDGINIGQSTFRGRMVDDPGVLYIGGMAPGREFFTGYLQDVCIYSRKLELGEITELYETPSRSDLTQISGYVTFTQGQRTGTITVQTVDDTEEEPNELFSVKLISAKGGAAIKATDNMALLTVLKSDNANGLFGFVGSCGPSAIQEGQNFSCVIERQRGDTGTVDITWALLDPTPNGPKLAYDVFVNATGQIVFQPGVRQQRLTLEVIDDDIPELSKQYDVKLMAAVARDGPGVTATSGASISAASQVQRITVEDSDYPHGLMQFSSGPPPASSDPLTPPATGPLQVSATEEQGYVTLLVVRAQGLTGDISVEWKTVDDTARSVGKTPPDYLVCFLIYCTVVE